MTTVQEVEKSFAQIMRDSFRDGLSAVIGKSGMEAVYINFKLEKYLMDPRGAHESLLPAFKEHGARILERAVIKEVYRKLNEPFIDQDNLGFENQFERTKNLYMTKEFEDR